MSVNTGGSGSDEQIAASAYGCANCGHDGSDHAFSDEMDDPCLCYALGSGPDRCLCPGFRRASADEKQTAATRPRFGTEFKHGTIYGYKRQGWRSDS